MKKIIGLFLLAVCLAGCSRDHTTPTVTCDIQKAYNDNAAKVTIPSGIWGTVSSVEGDCMPMVPPASSSCKNCPVKRTIQIYQYTLRSQATPSDNSSVFFDSFSTPLVAEVEADDNGFFQVAIPAGHYTMAVLENGKLYANGGDAQGGINPFTYSNGLQKMNFVLTYKAVF